MGAREEILARLRAARPAAPVPVPRAYDRATGYPDLVGLFVDRLEDYRATVHRCPAGELPAVLARLLVDVPEVAVPAGVPTGWLAAYPGSVRRDDAARPLTVTDLDAPALAVLTGCAVAIATTGTLVLDTGPHQGRRTLTLVPDHHICVVHTGQIVGGLPEALARLADPTRPLTLISGPSATSDIELNRVEGVHGPRRLQVVIVDT
ncbi:LutC/YkgG family protein [Micromonospora sp. H33]|uniref:LutC/YkgG family protein n=1 Tax=Micromonospora sp. H33 TaxID=3452215 RepID=UPI003F8B3CFF